MTPLVHIILVNWNGLDDTRACVESCLDMTYERFEIVVVDNASADGTAEQILPATVARLRTPVEATVSEASHSSGNLAFMTGDSIRSVKVASAPCARRISPPRALPMRLPKPLRICWPFPITGPTDFR